MKTMLIPNAEIDPRYIQAEQQLGRILSAYVGAPITEGVIKEIQGVINEYRQHEARRGVKLPKMRVIALPKASFIQVWPQDLTPADFDMRVKMLIKSLRNENRNHDPEELAKAIRRAYPEYSPSTSNLIH